MPDEQGLHGIYTDDDDQAGSGLVWSGLQGRLGDPRILLPASPKPEVSGSEELHSTRSAIRSGKGRENK